MGEKLWEVVRLHAGVDTLTFDLGFHQASASEERSVCVGDKCHSQDKVKPLANLN